MSDERDSEHLGAAILGFYAGIKLCRQLGYDPREMFELMNDDARVEKVIGVNPYLRADEPERGHK